MSTAIAIGFASGLLSTVNPCGFGMLPSFLSLYLGGGELQRASLLRRTTQGFTVGLAVSAGFAGVLVFAGLLVAAGLRAFLDVVPWLAVGIGIALVALGVAMLAGRHVGLFSASRVNPSAGERQSYRRAALFGGGYAVASLSCTLAVFLLVVSQATVGSPVRMLAVFGSYGAGSATVLVTLSLSAALAKGGMERIMRRMVRVAGRLTGLLLVASGAYLLLYWLPSIGGGENAASGVAAELTREVVSVLATFFANHVGAFAVGLAALVALGLVLMIANAAVARRGPGGPDEASRADRKKRSIAVREPAADGSSAAVTDGSEARRDRATALSYTVPAIDCAGCRAPIARELRSVPGVAGVEVDVTGRRVLVDGEGLDHEALREAIERAGYAVAD